VARNFDTGLIYLDKYAGWIIEGALGSLIEFLDLTPNYAK
jgi:hypothetical protein